MMVLSQFQKIEILRLDAKGKSLRRIANQIKCSFSSVSRLLLKYQNHRTIEILQGRGRKKETSDRTDRWIEMLLKRNRGITIKQIKLTLEISGICVSKQLIRNRLHKLGYRGYIKCKVPLISDKNRKKRVKYSRSYEICHPDYWKFCFATRRSFVKS